jgi:hypothetical protein
MLEFGLPMQPVAHDEAPHREPFGGHIEEIGGASNGLSGELKVWVF